MKIEKSLCVTFDAAVKFGLRRIEAVNKLHQHVKECSMKKRSSARGNIFQKQMTMGGGDGSRDLDDIQVFRHFLRRRDKSPSSHSVLNESSSTRARSSNICSNRFFISFILNTKKIKFG